jgi:toxin ParE1/3/4
MTISIKELASWDLQRHCDRLAERSAATADRFMTAVERALDLLESMPELGGSCELDAPQLADLRVLTVRRFRRFLLFYRPVPGGIELLRVLHGAQDVHPDLFE